MDYPQKLRHAPYAVDLAAAQPAVVWCLLLTTLLLAEAGSHPQGAAHLRTGLPECQAIVGRLEEQTFQQLRDAVQSVGLLKRKAWLWGEYLHHRQNPVAAQDEQMAWSIDVPTDLLEQNSRSFRSQADMAEARLVQDYDRLKSQGMIPANTPTISINSCIFGRASWHAYEGRPQMSFILEYYKRPAMIRTLWESLQPCMAVGSLELLVNVDSLSEAKEWTDLARETGGLVVPVFSDNVHESRGYNRLAHVARGEMVVIMADDDSFPADCTWAKDSLAALDRFPDIGAIALRGRDLCGFDQVDGAQGKDWYKDPVTGVTMMFIERCDMAPLVVRRSAFLNVGGFDESLTEPGDCGICTDWDLVHRMWVAGWQAVAVRRPTMHADSQAGGTHRNPVVQFKCWGKQSAACGQVLGWRYDNRLIEISICNAARELNLKHLVPLDSNQPCPYRTGCDLSVRIPMPA